MSRYFGLADYQSPASAGLGPWQNVYSDQATARAIASKFNGVVIQRNDANGIQWDVYYPAPLPQATVLQAPPSFTPSPVVSRPQSAPSSSPFFGSASRQTSLDISPLSMNQLTRDLWSQYDCSAIWQLAPLWNDGCYSLKFYKAPADQDELAVPNDYIPYGLRITPGSLIFGYYLPCIPNAANPWQSAPGAFTVQITDVSMKHKFFDDPVSSLFLANFKPTFQSNNFAGMGSFPNLLVAPYPVVGSGLFNVEIQETSGVQQRIQLVFGVLEVCNAKC